MSTLLLRGIKWEGYGMKDGKAILMHGDCTVSFDQAMGIFLFKQGDELILARELRCDCLQAATDCILDSYADTFVPMWEGTDGTTCVYVEDAA
jgi:hypothetical protein